MGLSVFYCFMQVLSRTSWSVFVFFTMMEKRRQNGNASKTRLTGWEKRKQLEDKRILEAYHESDETADEIIAFLRQKDKEGSK